MKFAICNETFENWEMERAFQRIREIGYDAVELAPFTLGKDPVQLSPQELKELKNAISNSGIEVAGLHWLLAKTDGYHLTTSDEAVRNRTFELLKQRVELCADLGGSVLVFGSPQQRSLLPGVSLQQARLWALDIFAKLAPILESNGCKLCIEPLSPVETDFINTADQAWEMARDVASPGVGIILDVKAMSSEPRPVAQTVEKHLPHTGHFHANDPNLRGPGFGDEDFRPIMAALKNGGYAGYVSVEVFNYEPDPETIAIKSLQYMKKCLAGGD